MTRNRRKSTLALLLSLVMVFSLLPGYAFAADEDPAIYQKSSDTQDDALHMRKTLSKNDDGTYDIVIESWATGTVDIETITRTRPTDFILIVDQSGSMEDPMQVVRAHSGNVTWWDISNSNIYLYQDPEDGQMYRLEATRNGNWALGTYIIRYTNGVQYKTVDSGNLLEMLFGNVSVSGSRVFSYTNGSVSRLNALKTAANHFLDLVKEKSDEESGTVYGDHRVAVIGFSSNPGRYTTNEILSGTKGHLTSTNLNTISDGAYDSALQQVQTSAGMTNLRNAISSITANGGTQPEYGFQIAQRVVERRNARGDNMYNTDEERNTVIVFFTDGQPGLYSFEPNDSNRQTDNHIKAANTAVASALPLKNLGASVFSIGVFAAGDSQPVIDYVETSSSGMTNYDNQFYDYERSGSFITGYSYEYWLRGNKKENDEPYNDTVADYMRCMSSDYQQAENFLNRSTANHEQGRSDNNRKGRTLGFEYYTLASDEQALRAAFEAVAESSITPVSGTELNSSAVLVDHIYMADFDVSGATVSAKTVDIQWDAATESVVPTGAEESFPAENITNTVRDDGGVSVTGFDYKENFCSEGHPGKKLVVMIKNLEPTVGGHLWSNSGDASIFPDADSTTAVLGVASPEENIARVTRVIDFNAKMTFATGVQRWRAVNTFKNGTYSLDSGNFNYQLLPDLSMTDPASSLVMSGADTALALGSDTVWTEYTAIPASSVYFDDDLLDTTLNVGDGSGFNEGVTVSPAAENLAKGQYTYTFYGTGIDVYCTTTDENAGTISAKLTKPDGTKLYENMYNYSTETRYNVPTVFFHDLPQGQYMLTLTAYGSSNYKLDGMRVYNPVSDQTLYNPVGDQTFNDNDARSEQYGAYVNLRGALINAENEEKVTIDDTQAAVGVLFVDNPELLTEDVAEIDLKTGEPVLGPDGQPKMTRLYTDEFEAYKDLGPKNEIYLSEGQAITFQLTDAAKAGNLWLGLSTPVAAVDGGNTVKVTMNGEENTVSVKNEVDQYYPLPKLTGSNNSIMIKNTGKSLVAITNLKITGVEAIYNVAAQTESSGGDEGAAPESFEDLVSMVFEPVTMQTVKLASNNGADPDAPKQSWDDNAVTAQTILKALFELLLNTLSNLFSGLGNW